MANVKITWEAKDETGPATRTATDSAEAFRRSLIGVAKDAAAAYIGLGAIKSLLVGSVRAYADQEQADAKLAASLRAVGQYSEQTYAALKNQASVLQETLGVQDDYVQGLQSFAVNLGVLPSQVDRVVRAALDFSTATGVDGQAAIKAMVNAGNGNIGMLKRYIPTLDEAAIKQGGLNAVLGEMGRFAGQAEAKAQTFGGQIDILKGQYSELQETIGQSLAAGGAIAFFADMVKTAKALVESWGHGVELITTDISILAWTIQRLREEPTNALNILQAAQVMQNEAAKEYVLALDEVWNGTKRSTEATDQHAGSVRASTDATKEAKAALKDYLDEFAKLEDKQNQAQRLDKFRMSEWKRTRADALKMGEDWLAQQEKEEEEAEKNAQALVRLTATQWKEGQDRADEAKKKMDAIEANAREFRESMVVLGAQAGAGFARELVAAMKEEDPEARSKAIMRAVIRAIGHTISAVASSFGPYGMAAGAIISAGTEIGAASMATGGVVGLGPLPQAQTGAIIGGSGAVPIIAHGGEVVINAESVQRLAAALNSGQGLGGGTTHVQISAVDAPSFQQFMGRGGDSALYQLALQGQGRLGMQLRRLLGVRV